ncbi:MAG: response regulator [Bacteroidia bacterium]
MESKRKLLCIDDEPINLLIMDKILGKKYGVFTARGGEEALDILENTSEIELVISDMHMPVMNGMEFIKEARRRFSNKKYFILSGYAKTEEIQAALDANIISEYFQKPANFQKIEQALEDS